MHALRFVLPVLLLVVAAACGNKVPEVDRVLGARQVSDWLEEEEQRQEAVEQLRQGVVLYMDTESARAVANNHKLNGVEDAAEQLEKLRQELAALAGGRKVRRDGLKALGQPMTKPQLAAFMAKATTEHQDALKTIAALMERVPTLQAPLESAVELERASLAREREQAVAHEDARYQEAMKGILEDAKERAAANPDKHSH